MRFAYDCCSKLLTRNGPLGPVAVLAGIANCPADGAAPVVTVEVRNLTDEPLTDVPVTFGQVFRKAHIPAGNAVRVVDCRHWQIDRKRVYDDGSLRFAVVSLILPQLPANGRQVVKLACSDPVSATKPPPARLDDLLKTGFDADVTLSFPDGAERTASVRNMLEQSDIQPQQWLEGPACTEWLLAQLRLQLRIFRPSRRHLRR